MACEGACIADAPASWAVLETKVRLRAEDVAEFIGRASGWGASIVDIIATCRKESWELALLADVKTSCG
uniref:Indole-3-glycerol-phosphate synthase n=1 Tax=Romanomermis culicivorax TaxID=13658 RepID=A0A915L4E1_ROMCU